MTNLTSNIIHGGQTQLHKFRMLVQVVLTTFVLSCAGSLMYLAYRLHMRVSLFELKVTASYYLAEMLQATSYQTVPFPGRDSADISWVLSNPAVLEITSKTTFLFKAQSLEAAVLAAFLFITITGFWIYKGVRAKTSKILNGSVVITTKELKSILKSPSPITIAGVPLLRDSETQHIMFAGTTGTGKSNAINELLLQIRKLGHKAVIVDTTSLIVPKFLREHDHLLNPMDARAKPWHLWAECQNNADIEALAESMIPQTGNDPFWSNAARTIVVESIKKMAAEGDFSTERLLDLTLRQPTDALCEALQNTAASSMVDPSAERMTMSIRSTLATHIKCLESVADTDAPFSIRQWMSASAEAPVRLGKGGDEGSRRSVNEDSRRRLGEDGWLFLNCSPGQRASMRPLLSGWLSIAMRALMDLPPSRDRRVWFIIDELPSLNVISDLPRALSELRKYGGCCVLGVQDLSQVDELYGHNLTRSIAGLTGTKVIFRAADEYNAERFSRFLGRQEVMESLTSITFGAHQVRDGVSLAEHRQMKPVVSPNDIMALDNLNAYLSLPGNVPVARVEFEYHKLPDQTEGIVVQV